MAATATGVSGCSHELTRKRDGFRAKEPCFHRALNVPETQLKSTQASRRSNGLRWRKSLRWVERLLACVGLCFIVYRLAFEFTVMTSDSMSPTLRGTSYEDGDRIILEKVSGYFRSPRRWEVYFYYDNEGTAVTKRIVGLPGEKISIKDNQIYINGVELPRPEELQSIKYYGQGKLANGHEVECGNGYFMLGDASGDSYDSRYTGIVTGDRFRARAWCIIWPRDHLGFVR